jgi:hypothetical protein
VGTFGRIGRPEVTTHESDACGVLPVRATQSLQSAAVWAFLTSSVQHPLGAATALVVGIVVLLLGGNWLVAGSVTIARRLGVSTLVVGLTIVAMGTSAWSSVWRRSTSR